MTGNGPKICRKWKLSSPQACKVPFQGHPGKTLIGRKLVSPHIQGLFNPALASEHNIRAFKNKLSHRIKKKT